MSKEMTPFLHRATGESYLFGYEDYMTLKELQEFWQVSMWTAKDLSEVPYGDIAAEDVIEITRDVIGLRVPKSKSALGEFILERAQEIAAYEYDRRIEAEKGIIDLNDEGDVAELELLRMRRTL